MAARGLGKGLGKGIDALIPNVETKEIKIKKENAGNENQDKEFERTVKITMVEPNREQPRKNFDEDSLIELAESIKQFGLLQPILVQDRKTYFEIVAGERRWRAAKIAGLKEVPVIVRNLTEQEIVEISLIENIQRENLNPIEEAMAYKRLLTEFDLKQDEVAERVSKSRTAVTNSMRLLKLCDEVQQMIIDDMITTGHARALISIEDKEQQYAIAQKIFDEKLSVRDVEKLVKDMNKPVKEKKEVKKDKSLEIIYRDIEEKIKQALSTKVEIIAKGDGIGKIEIEFYNHDDLDHIRYRIRQEENVNSQILNYIGLGGIDIGYILIGMAAMIVLSFLLIIILMIKVSKWKKKYSIFMQGKDAKSLEQDIIGLYEDNKFVKIAIEKNKNNIRELFKKHELSFQKFGIVKYDAFQQMGGQLSFSLVLLNENDNGFIINSVHSTEGCYSYSKEIKNGECSISLGEEEKKALNIALGINS